MLRFHQAHELASTWVRILRGDKAIIQDERTIKRPYGWVFFYESRAFLASGDPLDALYGNVPILVDRVVGEIRVTEKGKPIETFLTEYEAGLPPVCMQIGMPKEP